MVNSFFDFVSGCRSLKLDIRYDLSPELTIKRKLIDFGSSSLAFGRVTEKQAIQLPHRKDFLVISYGSTTRVNVRTCFFTCLTNNIIGENGTFFFFMNTSNPPIPGICAKPAAV